MENEEIQRYAVCDFGTRHKHNSINGFESCNCEKKFGMNPFLFDKIARVRYGIHYSSDITPQIQTRICNYIKIIDITN